MARTERSNRIEYLVCLQAMELNECWDVLGRLGVVILITLLD